tara:strand:- start:4520 stop:5923 length:1404 start_codon:yes stop_codon:yes gene_type:complete
MNHDEIKRIARLKAEELHEEWLEDRIGSKLSEGEIRRETANDEIGESVLLEEIEHARLDKKQLLNAYTDLMFIELKRQSYSQQRNSKNLLLSTETAIKQEAPIRQPKILISEKVEAFISEIKAKRSSIKEASLDEYRQAIRELIDILGDVNILDINYEAAITYRDTMKKLPKHRNQSKLYQKKNTKQLLELNIPDEHLLSARSINGRLSQLSAYFNWLERCDHIQKNPFIGLQIEESVKSYTPYTIDDLQVIFSSDLYTNSLYSRRTTTTQSHWWLIVIAAFTGARIGELIQMRPTDITESDGILSMEITDEGEGMSVKTSAGKRKFPIPPTLLELGFDTYIAAVKKTTATTLLPGIPVGRDKPGDIASKWYGRYKNAHLPSTFGEGGKVFHSFRHTFISNAMQCGLDTTKLQQIVGHEAKLLGETATYKGEGYSQKQLLLELNKFKYENLDLSKLKNDWKRLNMIK